MALDSSAKSDARNMVGQFDSFFTDPTTSEIYTLSLHDALPISGLTYGAGKGQVAVTSVGAGTYTIDARSQSDNSSDVHTSAVQSSFGTVSRPRRECQTSGGSW